MENMWKRYGKPVEVHDFAIGLAELSNYESANFWHSYEERPLRERPFIIASRQINSHPRLREILNSADADGISYL